MVILIVLPGTNGCVNSCVNSPENGPVGPKRVEIGSYRNNIKIMFVFHFIFQRECLKIPPTSSMHFSTLLAIVRVALLGSF
jgi:hypothetical protein